jgi:DNA-binding NarL/FixJ family response regulator
MSEAPDSIRVLLVDDEALVRAGLRMILASATDVEVVGEANDGVEAVEQARVLASDVVLMDIRMPRMDGLRALELIGEQPSPAQVIMLTTFDADEYVFRALQSGAAGFLLKDTSPRALIQAVRTVATGSAILSPALTQRLTNANSARVPESVTTRVETLSQREMEILPLIAQGLSNADIGRTLFLSEATVKAHVTHMLTKLGCENRVQVAIVAFRAGLVEEPP